MNQKTISLTSEDFYRQSTIGVYFYKEDQEIFIKDIIPDSLAYSYSPNYKANSVLGRVSPIQLYSSGSKKSYSFSLSLHEDMLVNMKYDTLEDLVDAIKSLSYPKINRTGETYLPSVYFQIGEIAGKGIITTSHSWQKPFRDGHFVRVDINVSITVEEIFPTAVMTKETQEVVDVGDKYVSYNDVVKISADSLLGYEDSFLMLTGRYNTATYDLISPDATYAEKKTNMQFTADYFDASLAKMSSIFSILARDYYGSDLRAMNRVISDLYTVKFDITNTKVSQDIETVTTNLENLRGLFENALYEYYQNVDVNMTKEAYNSLLDEINKRIDNMEDMYKEVAGYGASS